METHKSSESELDSVRIKVLLICINKHRPKQLADVSVCKYFSHSLSLHKLMMAHNGWWVSEVPFMGILANVLGAKEAHHVW
jgi:hypothetical protein